MFYWFDSESNSFEHNDIKNASYVPQIVWVITDKCKYHCPFCFQPKNNMDMDLKCFDNSILVCKKLGVQKIDISGGEPLDYIELPSIVEKLKAEGFHLTISTNGNGSASNQNWIAKHFDLFSRVIVSLNGYDKEYNNFLCGSEDAFEKLTCFLRLLKESDCKNLRINTVVTKTYLDENNLNKLIDLIKCISPYEWCLIQPHPENKKQSFDLYSISIDQFNIIVKKVKEKFLESKIRVVNRSVENYAGYWILNPNGKFVLHTDGLRESIMTDFNMDNVSKIISLSNKYGLWLPNNEE